MHRHYKPIHSLLVRFETKRLAELQRILGTKTFRKETEFIVVVFLFPYIAVIKLALLKMVLNKCDVI